VYNIGTIGTQLGSHVFPAVSYMIALSSPSLVIMAALRSRCGHYIFVL